MDNNQENSVILNVIMGKGYNITKLDNPFIISLGLLDYCRKRCESMGFLIDGEAITENEKSQFKIRRKSLRNLIAFLKNMVEMKGNDNSDIPDIDEAKEEIVFLTGQGVIPELEDCLQRGLQVLDVKQMAGWRRNTPIPTYSPQQKVAEKIIDTMESMLKANRAKQNAFTSTPRYSQNRGYSPHSRYSNRTLPWTEKKHYKTLSVGTPSPSPTTSSYSDEARSSQFVICQPYLTPRNRDDSLRAQSEPITSDEADREERRKKRKPISPPGDGYTSKSPLVKKLIGDQRLVTGKGDAIPTIPAYRPPSNTHFSDDLNVDPKHQVRIDEMETDQDMDYVDQEQDTPIDFSITPDPDALNEITKLCTEALAGGAVEMDEDPDFAPQATCPDGDTFACTAGCDEEFEWNAEKVLDHLEQRHSIDREELKGVLEGQIQEIQIDMPSRIIVDGQPQASHVKCFSRNKFTYELRGIEHEDCQMFVENIDQQLPFNPNRSSYAKWFRTTLGELFRVNVREEGMDTSPEPKTGSSPDNVHQDPTDIGETDTDEGNPKVVKDSTKGKKKELSKRIVSDSEDDELMVLAPPPIKIYGCRTVADINTLRKHEYLVGQKNTKVDKEYKAKQENWVTHDAIDPDLMKTFLAKKECKHHGLQLEESNARLQKARLQLQDLFPDKIRNHLDEFSVKAYEESNIKKIASNKYQLANGVLFSNEEDDGVQNARPRVCIACTEAFPGNNTSRHFDRCTHAKKIEEEMLTRRAAEHSHTIDPTKIISEVDVAEVLKNLKNGKTGEIAAYVSTYLEKIRQNLSVINIMCRTLYYEMLTLLSFDDCSNGGGEANRACLLLGELFNMMWMIIRMIPRREQQHRTVLAPEVKSAIKERDDAGNQTEKSKEATRENTRLLEDYGSGSTINPKRQKMMEKSCNDLLDSRDKKKYATEQKLARSKARRKDDDRGTSGKTRSTDAGKDKSENGSRADMNKTRSPDSKRRKEVSPNDSSDLFHEQISGGGNKNKTLETNLTKRTKALSVSANLKSSEPRTKASSTSASTSNTTQVKNTVAAKPLSSSTSTRAAPTPAPIFTTVVKPPSTASTTRTASTTGATSSTSSSAKNSDSRNTRSTKGDQPKSNQD